MIQRICASAHHLPMIADESVHVIVTSPPYYSLRAYAGEQAILWPTVEYSPMPGLPPIRVQGCEPGCSHEWVESLRAVSNNNGLQGSTLTSGAGPEKRQAWHDGKSGAVATGYCRHCGGWRGALGLEPDISSYIGHLVLCLREWKRILRADGTLWCNLGDAYAGGNYRGGGAENASAKQSSNAGTLAFMRKSSPPIPSGLKPKNLMMVPARFALAAQAEGWILRSDIIGAKVAPMPESVTDRPTRSHEHIFLLAKQQHYYYDQDAIREPHKEIQYRPNRVHSEKSEIGYGSATTDGLNQKLNQHKYHPAGRNLRDVIEWRPQPFAGAHFACFTERIPEIAILAGTSARGVCPQCGAGWVRCVERTPMEIARSARRETMGEFGRTQSSGTMTKPPTSVTTGWQPACECFGHFETITLPIESYDDPDDEPRTTKVYVADGPQPEPIPATVCDLFVGSGTTLRVAARLGRNAIGCDISGSYLDEIVPQRLGDGIQMEMAW